MPTKDRDADQLVADLTSYMVKTLCAMEKEEELDSGSPAPNGLIFPLNRKNIKGKRTRRVSEQESKIVASRWLSEEEYPFSIETPTVEGYTQTGKDPQAARTDITVFDGNIQRRLNIELKALQSNEESFRKDLEKLLREGVEGMWFHTLESADAKSWKAIGRKLWWSYRKLESDPICADAFADPVHSVRFNFFVLTTCELDTFPVSFANWETDLGNRFPED